MSVFRSYFSKNDTLIEGNYTNNSQNPVTEISYGTFDKEVTRFIFDVDLSNLNQRIAALKKYTDDTVKWYTQMTIQVDDTGSEWLTPGQVDYLEDKHL